MNDNTLRENIAALRTFGKNGNRITQGELGEALGLSASIISQYEQGTRVPTEENKARIAAYFGVTVDDLYSDKLKQALYTTLTQQGEGNNNIQNNGGIIQATNMVAQLNEYESQQTSNSNNGTIGSLKKRNHSRPTRTNKKPSQKLRRPAQHDAPATRRSALNRRFNFHRNY